jgi:hypothetical protein
MGIFSDLNDKDTNELESILVEEILGPNPGMLMNRDDEQGTLRDKVNRFFWWMAKGKDIKAEINETHILFWHQMGPDKPRWLDYYKGVLIKEIRDIKLKKLINI